MNVQVIGRIRPPIQNEDDLSHHKGQKHTSTKSGDPYSGFSELHTERSSTSDVFKTSIQSVVDIFIGGYNVCILIGGESGSGRSFSMRGKERINNGLVQLILNHVYSSLAKENYGSRKHLSQPHITMKMFEVYNEKIKDLMQGSDTEPIYLELHENSIQGVYLRNAAQKVVKDSSDAIFMFHQAWGGRTDVSTDYGPSLRNSAIFLQIELQVRRGISPSPYRSKFTIVKLPSFEKLVVDPDYLTLKEGHEPSRALKAFDLLVTSLSNNSSPDSIINYSNSKFTQLLQDELGGNCHTKALICLRPNADPDVANALVKFSSKLARVKNFPVVNDSFTQGLITQYRANIIYLKNQLGIGVNMSSTAPYMVNATSEVQRLQTENLVLKDQNERLQLRLDQLSNKFGNIAHTKTDLSQQLLLSEEEKLKVSQSLVEMQIENNKIKEEAEASNFELTNKIILLENQVIEAQNERDRYLRQAKATKERLGEFEADRKDLADEYVVLKTNYLALTNEHKKECSRNENLAIELLNLVNNKAALMRQVLILTNGDPSSMDDPNAEIARIRAIVQQNTSGKIKADQILGSQKDREQVEERLFASQRKFDSEINRLKHEYGDENKKTEGRMNNLMKELTEVRTLARERQQKISELNAKLIILRGEKEALEIQVNRLQHKVKDLGEDFRARLVKYVEDIAEYVDKGSGVPGQQQEKKMRDYCDSMLKDIRRSHREREDQLSQAAQTFKKRLQNAIHSYEQTLIAYRNLRQTCETRGFDRADLGPDEHEMKLGDEEIQSSHLKELDKTKSDLAKAKNELDAVKLRYGHFGDDKKENFGDINGISAKSDLWSAMRKQLREFTLNTQQQLEQERARLLSENQVLQQQLRESQEYIDSHLIRYKQEILRLRKLLGISEAENAVLTDRTFKNRKK